MDITASVFIATSLDGFIARPDGGIDWLMAANERVPAGEDCGYEAFMADIDLLVMGRKSFETVLGFDDWPYGDTPVVVLSSGAVEIPESLRATVSVSAEQPAALMQRLGAAGFHRVYVDGGVTIQRFLAAGLIRDLTVTVIPVLLGAGRPLFGPLDHDVVLTLVASRRFDFGFQQMTYRVTPQG